jgi:hypothetical protein
MVAVSREQAAEATTPIAMSAPAAAVVAGAPDAAVQLVAVPEAQTAEEEAAEAACVESLRLLQALVRAEPDLAEALVHFRPADARPARTRWSDESDDEDDGARYAADIPEPFFAVGGAAARPKPSLLEAVSRLVARKASTARVQSEALMALETVAQDRHHRVLVRRTVGITDLAWLARAANSDTGVAKQADLLLGVLA